MPHRSSEETDPGVLCGRGPALHGRAVVVIALVLAVAAAAALEQSFSDTIFPPDGWLAVNADSGVRDWQRLDIGARTPPGCAYCGWEGYYLQNNDWLVTPRCSVAVTDSLSFWCRAQDVAHRESLEVWVSSGPPRLPAFTRLDAFGTNSMQYSFHRYDLSQLAGQKVFLALVYRSWNQFGLMVDDVSGPQEWRPVHDAGVTAALAPTGNIRLGSVVRPACRVRNFAGSDESLRVSYDIRGFWHGDTSIALAAGESLVVAFPEVAFWVPDTCEVTFTTHLGTDECWWNDTAQAEVTVNSFQSRGGPDSAGYAWYDSDDPLGPDFDWQELYPSGTLLGRGDDTLLVLNSPWPFSFYGRDYSTVWISTNGWLGLGPPSQVNPADSNVAIPDPLSPNRLIAPFWDDLSVDGPDGGIWYQVFGDSVLVVEWRHARRNGCDPCSLDFEAKLFRSGAVEFHYANVYAGAPAYDAGMSATVGIEDGTGRIGLQHLYDGSPAGNLLAPGRAVRFVQHTPGVQEQEPRRTRPRLSVMPSCTRGAMRIEATGIQVVVGSVRVLDLGGRVRCVLSLTRTGPDRLGATWNGTDANGHALPDGVYFCEVTVDGATLRQKVVLAK
jgi:hypothetical protein